MTELTEGQHKAEFLVSEANGTASRDVVAILAGQNLKAGHVLGQISVGSATGAAVSGNTGNGTLSAVTVGAKVSFNWQAAKPDAGQMLTVTLTNDVESYT
ncbi:MAG: head decoration protein [Alphaproteobacteria bacterium]|nr:head decoration protein [Alphaproteobacteria bacterium]